ncbi:MAG TPA: hypothetical protein VFO10_23035 [Oligoflexus sp.]|uniref:hypothetical protein n=1 Tax=Oligoflexus sp. TaxID=1971216 RepID=UPI002D8100FE|nr:hypothetical protein [Oligoflexus sp.]HET9240157.1 hypothetical protein [Oligoflexus sp.]
MPRRLLIGFWAVLVLGLGCQKFKDRFDSVGSLCGVDPSEMGNEERFVKLESPDGQELSAETLLTTRSRFLLPSRGSENLAISSRGCVRIPASAGVLQAFSSARGWSISESMDLRSDRNLISLPLQASPKVSAELQCPTQGFFAHDELPFPLRWASDGALQSARFEITAVNEQQQKTIMLFEKPYGVHLTGLPANISTRDLPEGQYLLRLNFQLSTEGWDVPGPVPTRTESCPLTILHRRPEVGGLDAYSLDNRVAVFSKGSILPWKTPSPDADLLYCREPRAKDLDDGNLPPASDGCQPQNRCQDLKNFERSGAIVASDLGVFDYYAYAEDKAGNRSALSCQTLVVTEDKPQLELLWSEADWNKPAAQMLVPSAQVELRIRGQHPQLEDASLAARYQCKVDFVREDQSILSGRSVLCTSGRCRNQSMEKYVPCDADLQLSLVDLWSSMNDAGGLLRVFVLADDRAGHIEEKMATIGIHPKRWKPIRWSDSPKLEDMSMQLLQDKKGRIFSVGFRSVSLRDETNRRWVLWPSPSETDNGNITTAWFAQDNALHVQWESLRQNPSRYVRTIYRWDGTGWQALPSLDPENLSKCEGPQAFHRGGFYCKTTEGLALYEGGSWTLTPYPDATCMNLRQNLVRDAAHRLWLQCGSSLYQKNPDQSAWTAVSDPLPLVKIAADNEGRIWTLRGTGRDAMDLTMTTATESIKLPRPPSFSSMDLMPEDFVIGPASEVILGDAYWDANRNSWQVFPYLAQRDPGLRVNALFVGKGDLIWIAEKGLLNWDGERLRYWDMGIYGLQVVRPLIQAAIGQDSTPWLLASPGSSNTFPFQFQLRPWAYFPKPKNAPNTRVSGPWVNAAGVPSIYLQNEGLYTLESAGWTRSLRSPGLRSEMPVDDSIFEPILLSTQGIFRLAPDNNWAALVRFPNDHNYWGGTRDSQGRYWVYEDGSTDLGVIDGFTFYKVPLGADAGTDVKGIFASAQSLVVATDKGLFTRAEGQTDWTKSSWQDWGLQSVDRVRQIDDKTLFVSVSELGTITELWLLDLESGTKKPFAVPENASFLGNIGRTAQGDFVVHILFDVYRTDGTTYTKIFSRADLYSLPEEPSGTYLQIQDLQVDAQNRVWFNIGIGIVRIDLP